MSFKSIMKGARSNIKRAGSCIKNVGSRIKSASSSIKKTGVSLKSAKAHIKNADYRLGEVWLSEKKLKSSFYKVRSELRDMGLLSDGSKLDNVKIIRETFSYDGLGGMFGGVYGFYHFDDQNIHIPTIRTAPLDPRYPVRYMVDILRHEFGHALSDKYPYFFNDEVFVGAFGNVCGAYKVAKDGDEKNYVSDYARTNTAEDFAETFLLYMKHKGKLPKEFSRRKAIKAKWAAVKEICEKVAAKKK